MTSTDCTFSSPFTATVAPMVTIQFDIGSSTVNESDGSVTINLVRMGDLTDNISVCIGIIMIVDPGIVQRTYTVTPYMHTYI